MGDAFDTPCPNLLVQSRVEPHIGGSHCLLGEVDYRFDGPWGALFEGTAMHALVQVNGVLPGDDIFEG